MMLLWRLQHSVLRPAVVLRTVQAFGTTAAQHEKPLPPRRKIDEGEITESFLKGTGPGGQKINKTSSAVQLKHLPTGIVVKCQGTRSREQNRKDARRLLGERLEELEKGDESRTAIKAERARVKKASVDKKSRRKYKKLAEEKVVTDARDTHNREDDSSSSVDVDPDMKK
jgi:protein subunit release factor B